MACGCRGAIELRLPAGAVVLWRTCKCTSNPHLPFACDSLRGKGSELRLLVFVACWHCVGPQLGLETRKIVHIGYHHRWLRPTDYNEQVRYQGHHFRAHLCLICCQFQSFVGSFLVIFPSRLSHFRFWVDLGAIATNRTPHCWRAALQFGSSCSARWCVQKQLYHHCDCTSKLDLWLHCGLRLLVMIHLWLYSRLRPNEQATVAL